MKRLKVKSKQIESIGYSRQTEVLEVEFKNGGIYQYFNVPHAVYSKLRVAPSPGSFLHYAVKGRYKYQKVESNE